MTEYLVSMSVGPVQEFIAAARRTADLFAGSDLLRTVVGAAAASFPDPGSTPGDGPGAATGRIFPTDPTSGGANKILAIVPDPDAAVSRAKTAARLALADAWKKALRAVPHDQQNMIDLERAGTQLESFLELYAVWVPVTVDSYAQARVQVERRLAGRKALRDFAQQPGDDFGIPNSPLDPSRPSVVTAPLSLQAPKELRGSPLWLKPTEVLDAISLLKRLHGGGLGSVLSTRDLAQRAVDADFTRPEDDDFIPTYPYFAVLVADGDRMGALINARGSIDGHREISECLDAFGGDAQLLIETADGQCVYTGGDDVLALLPVPQVLECAQSLAESFAARIGGTLSVGVAIVHHRDPLSVSLSRARQAERLAKVDRNGLAVALHTRGGQPLRVTEQWPAQSLLTWLEHTRAGEGSRGIPYALRQLGIAWPDGGSPEALNAEIRRIIEHAQPSVPTAVLHSLPPLRSSEDLQGFADVLVLARFLTEGSR